MVDQPSRRLAALQGHNQGVNAQPRFQVIRHCPADDLARRQVLDGRQIEEALADRDVRDVGQPHGVGSLGREAAAEQVWRNREVVAAVRGLGRAPLATTCLQTHVAHQPLDPATRVSVPLPA